MKGRHLAAALLASSMLTGAAAAEQLQITFVHHASAANPFWQAVRTGMVEACELIDADCQMVFTQTEGNLQEQLNNLEAAIAQQPDGIITSLVDDAIFNDAVAEAIELGIPVIGANTDHSEGAAGNARLSFIGQNLTEAGYNLAQALSEQFPEDGPIHVLIGIAAPGQNWAELRGAGIEAFMEDYAEDNPDREITFEKIDSGQDLAIVGSRVSSYIEANPTTTAYFDVGLWHAGVAVALRDLGYEPGEVLLAGFDLVPVVLEEMATGYIQVQVDQQPYLQGFLPVMQLHLMKQYRLGAWDVDTGRALVFPDEVEAIMELSAQGVR